MVLFINAAFRADSRTLRLAEHYLERYDQTERIELGDEVPVPFGRERLEKYCRAVAGASFEEEWFSYAKKFAEADEIVIAAPFWNYSIPAVLHTYLEYVCTQGISFDLSEKGEYISLCRAKKLVYITTAGGPIPEEDHAFGYIRMLAENFFGAPELKYYKADAIDLVGADVDKMLADVEQMMDEEI